MRRTVPLLAATIILGSGLAALGAEPVDLSGWSPESMSGSGGFSEPGNWIVAVDGESVTQTVNGAPTFFATDRSTERQRVSVTFEVPATTDDDFVGLALGFNPGDSTNPDADYILIDWRRYPQDIDWPDSPPVTGAMGLAATRVTGVPLWGELYRQGRPR